MIITYRTAGPSYSTDASAAALSAMLADRPRMSGRAAASDDAGATNAAYDLETLYPSLFARADPIGPGAQAVRAVVVRFGVVAGCVAMFLAIAHH